MGVETKKLIIGTLVSLLSVVLYVWKHSSKDPDKTTEATTEVVTTEAVTTEVITTEIMTESITTKAQTEKPTRATGKMVFSSERKTAERIATPIDTEDSTGEINADGYGWVQLQYSAIYNIREDHLTKRNGNIEVFGHRETWYSTNEPGQTVTAKDIPGKHVADDGTIRDEDGFICVASSDLPFYSIVMTSVGPGKVYDCDCGCSSGTIDVYTNW